MTNKDKYLKDGVDLEELRDEFNNWYAMERRANSPGNYLVEFMNEEYENAMNEALQIQEEKFQGKIADYGYENQIMGKVIDLMAGDLLEGIRPSFWLINGIKTKGQVKNYYSKIAKNLP